MMKKTMLLDDLYLEHYYSKPTFFSKWPMTRSEMTFVSTLCHPEPIILMSVGFHRSWDNHVRLEGLTILKHTCHACYTVGTSN